MKRKSRTRAFTLIEILVVLAIIGIIAAILFPVLARSKRSALKATAISNAKQLFVGVNLYLIDNDNRYPVESYKRRGLAPEVWTEPVGNYIGKEHGTGVSGAVLDDDLPKVLFDPGKPYLSQRSVGDLDSTGVSGWGISDDLTNQASPTHFVINIPAGQPHFESEVSRPSECLMLCETTSAHKFKTHEYSGYAEAISQLVGMGIYGGGNTDIDAPYGGDGPITNSNLDPGGIETMLRALNITLFCDGHVKATHLSELLENGNLWSISGNGQWP